MVTLNKHQLKKLITDLGNLRSRHTELVSVYIPSGFNISVVKNQLSSEQALANNIQSKTTRKNVQMALDKALSELKYYSTTPENGLVVFAGNVSDNMAVDDLQAWSFEPPDKLTVRIYRTEPIFILDPLKDMIEPKYVYGLIVIDEKEVVIGVLKGKKIILLKEDSSMVPGKTRAGGQSAQRFQRVRQEIMKHWHQIAAEQAVNLFKSYDNLKGIIIGGAGFFKDSFVSSGHLGVLSQKILGVQDIGHSGIVALEELVEKSAEILKEEEVTAEKKIVTQFLEHLGKDDGYSQYGVSDVMGLINQGVVKILLISESLDDSTIEELIKAAEQFGTDYTLVSVETKEGEQLSHLGGVGAILRYKIAQ